MVKYPALVLLIFLALFCQTPAYGVEKEKKSIEKPEQGVYAEDIYQQFPGMDRAYEGPLPWEEDQIFQEALIKNKTPIKMAAYKATLHDPLPGEGYNVGLAASQLSGKVVQPGEIFSQNGAIGPYTSYRGYQAGPTYSGSNVTTTVGGGVCKIASLLYNVATFSDLKIVLRNPHSMTVPYVPPGQDATVFYGVKDIRFLNNTSGPVLIWSQKVDNTVYMALYGQQKPPKVTWHHLVTKRLNYWTVERLNSALSPGEEKILMPGQEGMIVRSWITVEYPDGTVTSQKRGTSWYSAGPCIIEHGPAEKN